MARDRCRLRGAPARAFRRRRGRRVAEPRGEVGDRVRCRRLARRLPRAARRIRLRAADRRLRRRLPRLRQRRVGHRRVVGRLLARRRRQGPGPLQVRRGAERADAAAAGRNRPRRCRSAASPRSLQLLSVQHNRRVRVQCFAPDDELPIVASRHRPVARSRTGSSARRSTCSASSSPAIRTCAASSPTTVSSAIRSARISR